MEKKENKHNSFFQTLVKDTVIRPRELPSDFKQSFLGISSESKITPLVQLWEYIDAKNCWASSRYEMAYTFILTYFLPIL